MNETIAKTTQVDEWIFEIKMVKAIKVKKHGEPYSAVASLTANGEQMYIDSHLSTGDEELNKDDFMAIYKFCQSIGMKNINYDRIKNGFRTSKSIEIVENQTPKLRAI
ncbi:hypothetical protein [Paraglaciecola sp. L3A3]|uniref:hypothetical protein n=1 Tax=Paraglaciecola sp. L3A3 TaxID=2686358 RepID=UPI00131B0DA1|nr:hypothetical protein [Paraglaciecola sp. L3A3]